MYSSNDIDNAVMLLLLLPLAFIVLCFLFIAFVVAVCGSSEEEEPRRKFRVNLGELKDEGEGDSFKEIVLSEQDLHFIRLGMKLEKEQSKRKTKHH